MSRVEWRRAQVKTKAELEAIARDIVQECTLDVGYGRSNVDPYKIRGLISEALERVQDEALNSVQLIDVLLAKYESLGPPQTEKEMKEMFAIEDQVRKLRDNIRIAPVKQISNEELEMLASKYATKNVMRSKLGGNFEPAGTVIDPDMRDSFIDGYRAAEKKAREK